MKANNGCKNPSSQSSPSPFIILSPMALKLSSHLPLSLDIKTHKKIERHPHFLLLTYPKLSSFGCPFSPNGGRGARAVVSLAVSEEQTQYSAGTAAGVTQVLESSPSSSSSKVVLVIGGTGGVGKPPFAFRTPWFADFALLGFGQNYSVGLEFKFLFIIWFGVLGFWELALVGQFIAWKPKSIGEVMGSSILGMIVDFYVNCRNIYFMV